MGINEQSTELGEERRDMLVIKHKAKERISDKSGFSSSYGVDMHRIVARGWSNSNRVAEH